MSITINSILSLIQEYQRLNAQFGFLSCLDFPKEYDRMDNIQIEIGKLEKELTNNTDISLNGLSTALESVASDMDNGNLSPEAKLTLYTQSDFIDYLASTMTRKEAERFKDMAYWMDENARSRYIETRFILEFENDRNEKRSFYHDERLTFVIIAE